MSVPESDSAGWLHVEMDDSSGLLRNILPVVVRDGGGAVVDRIVPGASVRLPIGLYSLATLTPDGEGAVKHAHIAEAMTTSVTFEAGTIIEPATEAGSLSSTLDLIGESVSVEHTDGCTVTERDAAGWVFVPMDQLDSVPSAVFRVENRRILMSLPLNPRDSYSPNSCRVDVARAGYRWDLRMSFPPERRAARLIDGLVRHGEIGAERGVLREATDLLSDKYFDPAGAVLGGLTLERMGLLRERLAWIENLARDFVWLADGPVLLASLLRHDSSPQERQRGLSLLLAAASKRPLYTDGLSLLMELLRRWPDEASKDQRYNMLEKLAEYSAYADWDSVNLSVELPE